MEPSEPAATMTMRAVSEPGTRWPVSRLSNETLVGSVGKRLDPVDQVERADVGVVLVLGDVEVVSVESVLGQDVAADITVSEVNAGSLLLPVLVCEGGRAGLALGVVFLIGPVGVERDGQVEFLEAIAEAGGDGGVAHQLHPSRPLAVGNGLDVHEVGDCVIMGLQLLVIDLGAPALFEERAGCFAGDVGVDERAAATRGARGDRHSGKHAEVEPAVLGFRAVVAPEPPVLGLSGEVGLIPAPAALEDEHL